MIDVRLLLDDFDATARRLARKRVDPALVTSARDLAVARRTHVKAVDESRRKANAGAAEIGKLMRAGQLAHAEVAKAAMAADKAQLEVLETALRATEAELDDVMAGLPNLPADVVPDGAGEADNVVVRTEGFDPADYAGRTWDTHWDVAARLGLFDAERAAKLSGTMFSLLRGDGARLLRGLVNFALDLHRDRYEEIAPAHMVREEVITRTGHLTKFESQAYRLRDDDLWLLPTAEVALMGLYQGEILPEADLPRRMMAYTVCWRREAGAAGKDTRGMQRLHEFHKVELVSLVTPEEGEVELMALLADAEKALVALGLPYRVVELCAGDLTFSAARVFDLEVYAPGLDRWLEVSSVSLITDFQGRRGGIRFRRTGGGGLKPGPAGPGGHKPGPAGPGGHKQGGKVELVHSLNGSGLATPRVWAAIVEHGQQSDGSVVIPDVLAPYLGTDTLRPPT